MPQQRVYDFNNVVFKDTDTCPKTEEFLTSATEKSKKAAKATGAIYERVYCCLSENLINHNYACHSAFSRTPAKELVLNVHKLANFNTKGLFQERFIKEFYDWLYSEKGPWGPAMKNTALLLEEGSDIVLGCLWLNPAETPVDYLIHNCISSRILTEHAKAYSNTGIINLYNEFGHMGFAFAACHFFKDGKRRNAGYYVGHSGYSVGVEFPLSYATNKSEAPKVLWKKRSADVYVNKYWEKPSIAVETETVQEFFKVLKPYIKEYV